MGLIRTDLVIQIENHHQGNFFYGESFIPHNILIIRFADSDDENSDETKKIKDTHNLSLKSTSKKKINLIKPASFKTTTVSCSEGFGINR